MFNTSRTTRAWSACRIDPDPFEPSLRDWLKTLGIAYPGQGDLPVCSAGRGPGDAVPLDVRLTVGAVKEFIDAHADEDLDLDRIAGAAGMSKFQLVRIFREATGQTPWSYVQDVRVRKAKELLETDLTLAEIALQSGFFDQSHFTRTFRNAEGEPPGRYRKRRKIVQDRPAVHS